MGRQKHGQVRHNRFEANREKMMPKQTRLSMEIIITVLLVALIVVSLHMVRDLLPPY